MPVFYDHGPTRVTDRWLTVGDQRFAIGRLSNLRTTRVSIGRLRWWRADHLLLGEYNGRPRGSTRAGTKWSSAS
jgi:hypothetical protein